MSLSYLDFDLAGINPEITNIVVMRIMLKQLSADASLSIRLDASE